MRSELEELPLEFEPLHLALLDSLPDGVWFADRQGIVRFWSKRAEAITGFAANEALGAPFRDILSYCGETGEPAASVPLRETLDDQLERRARMFLLHKQGHRIAVEVRTMPVRSATGEVIGAREARTSLLLSGADGCSTSMGCGTRESRVRRRSTCGSSSN